MVENLRAKNRKDKKRRLLDQGLHLIAQKGLNQCTIEDITKTAGVAKGTFFTHFSSKEVFLDELVSTCLADLGRRISPLAVVNHNAVQLLANLGGVHLRYFQLRPYAASLLMQILSVHGVGPTGQNNQLQNHIELVAGLIKPKASEFNWPEERCLELALAIFSMSCGLFVVGSPLGLTANTPTSILNRFSKVVAKGITAE